METGTAAFIAKVKSVIEKYHMLSPLRENRLILGLSGGMDSMCLLDALTRLNATRAYEISLRAVHVNHCLRGADADADEAFVRDYCEKNGVPVLTFRADVRGIARRDRLSVEEAGRAERAMIFREVMAETGADALALAHHLDDSVETVLMRIGRGSGPAGLEGIKPAGMGIIRPFIETRREEIARYAAGNGIPFRHDKSNDSRAYTRNRVRHELLPAFERVFGHDVGAGVARLASIVREENECMDGLAATLGESSVSENGDGSRELYIPGLSGQSPALIKRLFRLILRGMDGRGKDVSHAKIDGVFHLLDAQTGKAVFLPRKIRVLRSYDRLIFDYQEKKGGKIGGDPAPGRELAMEKAVFEPDSGLWFTMSAEKKDVWQNCDNICTKIFLCDKISGIVEIRTRRPGDRIKLKNAGTQKLSDYFVNNKVPQGRRDAIPLVALGGDILWVLDERGAVGADFAAESGGERPVAYIQIWRRVGEDNL